MNHELAQVEDMLGQHMRFARIEGYIDALVELDEDTRSALWLFAWAETNRRVGITAPAAPGTPTYSTS